ncbi:hypothetical protein CCAX7_14980 [Capsulimonas corticalis]|uniref:Uncharacterized protein n=1 Tax=Capsulimonas corticalis TaxID=2219043 RepID=A0A402CZE4_9BACT|nr:hypothetical protein [Capsulimonas corticalis]BDI29447.1 hypothetical protein CCAX7_14980 [Capsulimonas corticalis]
MNTNEVLIYKVVAIYRLVKYNIWYRMEILENIQANGAKPFTVRVDILDIIQDIYKLFPIEEQAFDDEAGAYSWGVSEIMSRPPRF